jgi:hypothetical protein
MGWAQGMQYTILVGWPTPLHMQYTILWGGPRVCNTQYYGVGPGYAIHNISELAHPSPYAMHNIMGLLLIPSIDWAHQNWYRVGMGVPAALFVPFRLDEPCTINSNWIDCMSLLVTTCHVRVNTHNLHINTHSLHINACGWYVNAHCLHLTTSFTRQYTWCTCQ